MFLLIKDHREKQSGEIRKATFLITIILILIISDSYIVLTISKL